MNSSLSVSQYEASGGRSQLRTYPGGEEATVELHRRSFSVIWSAAIPVQDFHSLAEPLVHEAPDSTAWMSTIDHTDTEELSGDEALQAIDAKPSRYTFIRFNLVDRAVTWQAPILDKSCANALGEVGVICRSFDRDWLGHLIVGSATPLIVADADALLAATEELTAHLQPEIDG